MLDGKMRGAWRIRTWLSAWANPERELRRQIGLEDFSFPGSHQLLRTAPERPHVLHCHNLHGSYFDLRALPRMSRKVPTVLTLHDAWLLSGHCAHPFSCVRWTTGCGRCPNLSIYPPIRRDATAYNWKRKRRIYEKSTIYLTTPSKYLMQKVERSIMAPAVAEARVIPNGVDLSVFHPGDKVEARASLRLPQAGKVLVFAGYRARHNAWKDYETMRAGVERAAALMPQASLLFVALGEEGPIEQIGQARVVFVPYQNDPKTVVRYYQAADIYLHAAKTDTFPNTVLEALACGAPVVATAVGGIPEQVKGLRVSDCQLIGGDLNRYDIEQATGILVPPRSPSSLAAAIAHLLGDEAASNCLARNAVRDSRARFDLKRQVTEYLGWYEDIVQRWSTDRR